LLKESLAAGIILLFMSSGIIPDVIGDNPISTKTIYVDDDNTDGPWDGTLEHPYRHIQDAIDVASDGDTIFAYSGTYSEKSVDPSGWYYINAIIDKPLFLIGEDKKTTIIDGEGSRILEIQSSYVTISGFTLENASNEGAFFNQAIVIMDRKPRIENICITDCIMKHNDESIQSLNSSSNILITNCYIHNNTGESVSGTYSSSNITVENCIIENNGKISGMIHSGGISLGGTNITISNCSIHDNIGFGILIFGYSQTKELFPSRFFQRVLQKPPASEKIENVNIHHNIINNNSFVGIVIGGIISNCIIRNNLISYNGDGFDFMVSGILLQDTEEIIIQHNNIFSNDKTGICTLRSYDNNIFENNIYDNIFNGYFYQVKDFFSHNNWNNNFWDDYNGFGPNPVRGLVEIPLPWNPYYLIRWFNFDWHPAQEPYDIP